MSYELIPKIDAILAVRGAEYQAVCRGLKGATTPTPPVVGIPMGSVAIRRELPSLLEAKGLNPSRVVLMGLCGALQPQYEVGDVVACESCLYVPEAGLEGKVVQHYSRDVALTEILAARLGDRVHCVNCLTRDRAVCSAAQKRHLGEQYRADVVDMEGYGILEILNQLDITVAILRVVSDDAQHDIPDLNAAIDSDGTLRSRPLMRSFLRNPLAAVRFIRSSLRGLKALQAVTRELFLGYTKL
ncbi:phosphorylase [Lusitaniella coriacea LEGE 07157]|uniref:Phosphorylase n=2 Tax=Lusitaniella TaxID=1983104 RepID=A0A8J7DUV9_9CYAN|nr:phosphorylase [Lusitaniella coriacea LEGE 07157]